MPLTKMVSPGNGPETSIPRVRHVAMAGAIPVPIYPPARLDRLDAQLAGRDRVVRHELVARIVRAYDRFEKGNAPK